MFENRFTILLPSGNADEPDQNEEVISWAMLPYPAWVTFAAVLNVVVWRMNG